jgi:hypothetical protein
MRFMASPYHTAMGRSRGAYAGVRLSAGASRVPDFPLGMGLLQEISRVLFHMFHMTAPLAIPFVGSNKNKYRTLRPLCQRHRIGNARGIRAGRTPVDIVAKAAKRMSSACSAPISPALRNPPFDAIDSGTGV